MEDENMHKLFDNINEAEKAIPLNTLRGAYIGEQKICIVNNQNTFYAVSDSCPHMGGSLSKGSTNNFGEVICPLHQYRFNLKSGQESGNRCDYLEIYPVKVSAEGVFVEIS
jgi:nitrite reductase/ring-hydroxylating ferredoxin subunit